MPEAPAKSYSMTLKQRVAGTKMNADIPVGCALIFLDFSGSAQFCGTGSIEPFLRTSNNKEKSEVRLRRKLPKSLN